MRFALTPGHAAIAQPCIRGGFEFAVFNRAGDEGPVPSAVGWLDLIACPGLPALWASEGKKLQRIFSALHVQCVGAMAFRVHLQKGSRDILPQLRDGIIYLNVFRPPGAKVQLQRNTFEL